MVKPWTENSKQYGVLIRLIILKHVKDLKAVEFHFHVYNHRRDSLELKYSVYHPLSPCNTR